MEMTMQTLRMLLRKAEECGATSIYFRTKIEAEDGYGFIDSADIDAWDDNTNDFLGTLTHIDTVGEWE